MKLLDFVALYGLLLMPMGAVIVVDTYLLPRLNLRSLYAETFDKTLNWAAGLTWLLTLVFCLYLSLGAGMEIFFLGLPGWFAAALSYVVLSMVVQRRRISA
jgi:cytosine/uracil/thiamine/allantoin permease